MARDVAASWAEAVPQAPAPMTADDLARLPNDAWGYELINGRLVRKMPSGGEHGDTIADLQSDLHQFVKRRQLGRVLPGETGFNIAQPGQLDTVLAPDLAFVRADRVPPRGTPAHRGYWRLAPDLVVEVASPSQYRPELADKARAWLAAGTRLVWVIWPEDKQVDVWHPGQISPNALSAADALDGEDVIPGFTYPAGSLFE